MKTSNAPFKLTPQFIEDHLLPDLIHGRVAPALLGSPGIGKTSALRGLTESTSRVAAVFHIGVNTLAEAADFTGTRTVPDPKDPSRYTLVFFPHQTIQKAVDAALENPDKLVVLILDEINRAQTSDITSAALTLVTERYCGNLEFPDNLRLAVTGNDTGNISKLDSASLTRFSLYKVGADAAEALKHFKVEPHPAIKAALDEHPEWIECAPVPENTGSPDPTADPKAGNVGKSGDAGIMDALASFAGGEELMVQYTNPRTIEGLNLWLHELGEDKLRRLGSTNDMVHPRTGRKASELLLSMIAHTGDTAFTADVYEKLQRRLQYSTPAAAPLAPAGPSIDKPKAWDEIVKMTARDDVVDAVLALSHADREALLAYSLLRDNEDRATTTKLVIETVLSDTAQPAISDGTGDTLVQLGIGRKLSSQAVSYLLSHNGHQLVIGLSNMASYLLRE